MGNQEETSKLEKIFAYIKDLRIEPFMFLFLFGYVIRDVSMQSVMMDKACMLNLQLPQNICSHLDDHKPIKDKVQKITLNYRIGVMLISFIPAIISSTLLSPWSDKYGRKLPIMAAVFGVILEGIASTIIASIASAPLYFFLIAQIPSGLFGGFIMAISSTFTYLSDVTTEESRSVRYAILEFFFILSNPAGLEIGGQVYNYYGGVPVFIIALVANVGCFFWAMFILKETRGLNEKKIPKEMVKQLFTLENLKITIRTCVAKRPGNLRTQIWLMVLAVSILFFCEMGSSVIGFLYANDMYDWSNPKFSTIAAIVQLSHGIGLIIIVPILTKVLFMPEAMIGLVGILSYLGECSMKVVAYKEWMYYVAYVLGALAGASNVAVRARVSKMVTKDELSKVFSLLALCQSLTPVLSIVVFGPLYAATLEYFPGASYLLISLMLSISAAIFVWIHKQGPLPTSNEINQGGYRMESFLEG